MGDLRKRCHSSCWMVLVRLRGMFLSRMGWEKWYLTDVHRSAIPAHRWQNHLTRVTTRFCVYAHLIFINLPLASFMCLYFGYLHRLFSVTLFVLFVSGRSSTGPSTRKEPTTAGAPASPTEWPSAIISAWVHTTPHRFGCCCELILLCWDCSENAAIHKNTERVYKACKYNVSAVAPLKNVISKENSAQGCVGEIGM